MLTQQFITAMEAIRPDIGRPVLLSILDMALGYILDGDTYQRRVTDPATGHPPYFATTDGVLHYECPADCAQTIAVFSEEIERHYSQTINYDGWRKYYYQDEEYYEAPVLSNDAQEGQPATLDFTFNPGTTTNVYLHLYIPKPRSVSSERIQIPLPPGKAQLRLQFALLELIKNEDYGDTKAWERFERHAFEIKMILNRGTQARPKRTPIQPEQEYVGLNGYFR